MSFAAVLPGATTKRPVGLHEIHAARLASNERLTIPGDRVRRQSRNETHELVDRLVGGRRPTAAARLSRLCDHEIVTVCAGVAALVPHGFDALTLIVYAPGPTIPVIARTVVGSAPVNAPVT
jgi:hypothetical protein